MPITERRCYQDFRVPARPCRRHRVDRHVHGIGGNRGRWKQRDSPRQVRLGIAAINAALNSGITYDPHSPQPQTDSVTFDVVTVLATPTGSISSSMARDGRRLDRHIRRDVIFATGHDSLTGGASADQFVFAPETSPSADRITDFKAGEDDIDLRAFSFVDSSRIASWLGSHAAASGADTRWCHSTTAQNITLKNVALANRQRLHRIAASLHDASPTALAP